MDSREYRLMKLTGAIVICSGALAANFESISGAVVALSVGAVILGCGVYGSFLGQE
ncbi:hypothetical protein ACFQUU_28470 [Herbaspirillum sp. GCM10030257]|uniref:hypothetical protein n=1 Tax=Herbaspirillum sp. GCM10030257 TaxID=3273393 RepID=UPI00361B09CF